MPNRIQEVEDALCGNMEMQAFMALIRRSPALQEELQSFIPPSAICNPSHDFWNKLKRFGTRKDVTAMQILEEDYRLGFGNSFAEDLNTHSDLGFIYCYWFPQTPLTTIYLERERLFLSAVGEYFGGSEVTPVLCSIITEALQEKTKTAQKKKARELVVRAFHVEGRNRPYWIQGADWPMGTKSPMKYLSRIRRGEKVTYLFQDVDTLQTREVEQYY